jgi:A/G-specific adenine glycosylase
MMLQQTQADRVVSFYSRWLKQFPTITSLASASVSDVLRAWSGLGYNNRALRLHRLAAIVVQQYQSKIPDSIEALEQLPGIGRYTAHAVSCFAFEANVPVVDVNIRRILTRVTQKIRQVDEMLAEQDAWNAAARFLPRRNVYDWNQALMDLGATLCTARASRCADCPLKKYCLSACAPAFAVTVKKEKTSEPTRKGIPRRLYRGRILKMLHRHRFSAQHIASELWSTHTIYDRQWLRHVLATMCNDGLLKKQGSFYSIA